jgi:hypothetical protein
LSLGAESQGLAILPAVPVILTIGVPMAADFLMIPIGS